MIVLDSGGESVMNREVDAVVFDLGGVLIDWNPRCQESGKPKFYGA